jgi:hypothetical protein
MDPESVTITAGLGGFLSFFLLAVALYLLMRNMNARLRRMAYREEQETRAAEGIQGDVGQGPDPSDSPGPQGGPAVG